MTPAAWGVPYASERATSDSTPAVKRWGPLRRQGLCSYIAHLWATSNSAPRSQAVGTPQAAVVM